MSWFIITAIAHEYFAGGTPVIVIWWVTFRASVGVLTQGTISFHTLPTDKLTTSWVRTVISTTTATQKRLANGTTIGIVVTRITEIAWRTTLLACILLEYGGRWITTALTWFFLLWAFHWKFTIFVVERSTKKNAKQWNWRRNPYEQDHFHHWTLMKCRECTVIPCV